MSSNSNPVLNSKKVSTLIINSVLFVFTFFDIQLMCFLSLFVDTGVQSSDSQTHSRVQELGKKTLYRASNTPLTHMMKHALLIFCVQSSTARQRIVNKSHSSPSSHLYYLVFRRYLFLINNCELSSISLTI